jgi:hypothetical protein
MTAKIHSYVQVSCIHSHDWIGLNNHYSLTTVDDKEEINDLKSIHLLTVMNRHFHTNALDESFSKTSERSKMESKRPYYERRQQIS